MCEQVALPSVAAAAANLAEDVAAQVLGVAVDFTAGADETVATRVADEDDAAGAAENAGVVTTAGYVAA